MSRRSCLLVLALPVGLLAAPAGAATRCVKKPPAGACFASIQAAVAASGPGDVVTIGPGVYLERVIIPADREALQLVGASKLTTIIDPDQPLPPGAGIRVLANGVTVKNLGIRNGQDDGIVVLAHDVTVQGVRIVALRGDVSTGIFASGDGLQLVGNEIRAVGFEGIRVSGSNAVVKGNTVAQAPRGGVHVVGDAARVTSNKVTGANGGVLVAGSGAVVTMNVVERVVGGGLTVVGPDPTVQKNKLINAGTADVECNPCSGGTVSGNASLGSGSYGFAMTANAPGLVVQGNTVTRAAGPAFILNGSQVQARANAATDTGFFGADGFGFMVQGAGHTLTGNKATRCAASGFFVLAANTTLASGTATQAGVSGFTVAPVDGTALIGNTALSSSGAGFAVLPGALNTSVDQNKASKNRYGFCDLGMGTAVGTNNFGVPGVSTNCDMLQ